MTALKKEEILDEPGGLRWINKLALRVDAAYQRKGSVERARSIARKWSWIACGVIVVAERNGFFYVVDGQHRVLAANRREEITKLPCLVFTTTNEKNEAQGFVDTNINRRPLFMQDRFNALIIAEDETAKIVDSLFKKHGLTIVKSVNTIGQIACVAVCVKCAKQDVTALDRVLGLCVELNHPRATSENIVSGLFYFHKNTLAGIDDRVWKRAITVGCTQIDEQIYKARAYHSSGGPKICAEGITKALNYRARDVYGEA